MRISRAEEVLSKVEIRNQRQQGAGIIAGCIYSSGVLTSENRARRSIYRLLQSASVLRYYLFRLLQELIYISLNLPPRGYPAAAVAVCMANMNSK